MTGECNPGSALLGLAMLRCPPSVRRRVSVETPAHHPQEPVTGTHVRKSYTVGRLTRPPGVGDALDVECCRRRVSDPGQVVRTVGRSPPCPVARCQSCRADHGARNLNYHPNTPGNMNRFLAHQLSGVDATLWPPSRTTALLQVGREDVTCSFEVLAHELLRLRQVPAS